MPLMKVSVIVSLTINSKITLELTDDISYCGFFNVRKQLHAMVKAVKFIWVTCKLEEGNIYN